MMPLTIAWSTSRSDSMPAMVARMYGVICSRWGGRQPSGEEEATRLTTSRPGLFLDQLEIGPADVPFGEQFLWGGRPEQRDRANRRIVRFRVEGEGARF